MSPSVSRRGFLKVLAVFLVCMLVAGAVAWKWLFPGRPAALRPDVPSPAIIAHRAASGLAPEATEPAYLLARDLGADYVEIDMHRSKDGVLFGFHDDNPSRTTNAAEVFPGREKDNVETFTMEELKQLDAGSWFNAANPDKAREKFKGVKILTVDEIITLAESGDHHPALHIETKNPKLNEGYEKELVDLLKARGWLDKYDSGLAKVTFQSFYVKSLERLKELAPEVPRVYLAAPQTIKHHGGWEPFLEAAAEAADGIGPVGYIAWPWNLRKTHKAGLFAHVYTVNAPWQYWLLDRFGADGMFTDRCDLLLKFYGRDGGDPGEILAKYGY